MNDELTPTTRREVIEQAYDAATEDPVVETKVAPAAPEAPIVEAQEKPGRTANRLREENGRLMPGKKEAPVEVAPVAPVVDRPQRPSSWKKDYWEHWDKLDPSVAKYIHEREQQFSSGVSTYKAEADKAREIQDAIAPFIPTLQQHGIQPSRWITNLGNAHHQLALGTPEQKLETFQRLTQEYGVNARLVTQDAQGQWQFVNAPAQQPVQQQPDVAKLVDEKFQAYQLTNEIQQFATSHPHYEVVRQTMSGLLSSGLAQDLQTAYDAALTLPQHSELAQSDAQQQSDEAARKRAEEASAVATRARGRTISTKPATPSAMVTTAAKKDRRATLEEAYDQHFGGGRV